MPISTGRFKKSFETSELIAESEARQAIADPGAYIGSQDFELDVEWFEDFHKVGRLGREAARFSGKIALDGEQDGVVINFSYAFQTANALGRAIAKLRSKEPPAIAHVTHGIYDPSDHLTYSFDDFLRPSEVAE